MDADIGVNGHSKGIPATTKSWKRQGMGPPLELPEGAQPCQHLDSSSGKLVFYFWPPEMWQNKFLLFEATKFMVICQSSQRKLTQAPNIKLALQTQQVFPTLSEIVVFGDGTGRQRYLFISLCLCQRLERPDIISKTLETRR